MLTALLTIVVLAVPPAHLDTSPTPTTRLFVRSVPPGATVTIDGEAQGAADRLFVVPHGVHKVTVELDGHVSETREIDVPAGRIFKLQVKLKKLAGGESEPASEIAVSAAATDKEAVATVAPSPPQDPAGQTDGSEAASTYLSQSTLPASTRHAMLTVLRQHPSETRWSGRDGDTLFGIAVKPLPQAKSQQRVIPSMLELVQMLAVHEVLKAKSLLDRYAAAGLTDATTLRQAVEAAAGQLQVTGKAKGVAHQAAVRSGYAVAYVLADQSELTAHLLQPTELQKVQAAYREVMHSQARELMARSSWADALLLWQHLHRRKLVSQGLYLDAARCFHQLCQSPDAVRVLTEAIDTFGKSGTAEFLEQAGDIALEIRTDDAQRLAERAYQQAIDSLRDTVSGNGL